MLTLMMQEVKKKIETGTYNEPSEFVEDVNLIFDNAMLYNPSDNDVYYMCALCPYFITRTLTPSRVQGAQVEGLLSEEVGACSRWNRF
jgi:hypothetical protein